MIGVYDTGLGGVQIMRRVQKLRPDLEYRFFQDHEMLPLGDKTHQQIKDRVTDVCEQLFQEGCQLVIMACNTASVHTIRYLQQELVPNKYPGCNVIGVTKPLIEYVVNEYEECKTQKGCLLATQATIDSGFYQHELLQHGFVNLQSLPAVGLADAIERQDVEKIQQFLIQYTDYCNIDYLILACTHYSLAVEAIQKLYPHLIIIDPSQYTAERIVWYVEKHPEYQCIKFEVDT